ncbi:unnamed protein product [Pleuronectes platessa]|uniref:Uncharacterized protein n=1 Tax=Pleuronectes platessa TaxID=8262 RepID=A0A9N7W3F7_PLEPL|nr:unnamed protein product [Pleuronectes platessa]
MSRSWSIFKAPLSKRPLSRGGLQNTCIIQAGTGLVLRTPRHSVQFSKQQQLHSSQKEEETRPECSGLRDQMYEGGGERRSYRSTLHHTEDVLLQVKSVI